MMELLSNRITDKLRGHKAVRLWMEMRSKPVDKGRKEIVF
jgi:hypothetical protein